MNDIQASITNSSDKPNEIHFSRQKDQQRELSNCEPARANADSFIVLFARDILLDEFESKDESYVEQEENNHAKRWQLEDV